MERIEKYVGRSATFEKYGILPFSGAALLLSVVGGVAFHGWTNLVGQVLYGVIVCATWSASATYFVPYRDYGNDGVVTGVVFLGCFGAAPAACLAVAFCGVWSTAAMALTAVLCAAGPVVARTSVTE